MCLKGIMGGSMLTIETMQGHDRMSTEALLKSISAAVAAGETEFTIHASGQHDIGGPLWNKEGKPLHFHVTNAGQRVGSMCLPGTDIIVHESASADVGWLNSGGTITVLGDAGDTTGHCAAGGRIYIGGRAGTRTGSLMKHDPLYDPPELWILREVGSFSFEFMGGGIAVVCGLGAEDSESVLGSRSCVGMLGGVVYVRGPASGYPKDIRKEELDRDDKAFLAAGMKRFLAAIGREDLYYTLTRWDIWHKLVPLTFRERQKEEVPEDIKGFRLRQWIPGGLFSDVANEDYEAITDVQTGLYRLRVPVWENHTWSAPCEAACPAGIPTEIRYNLLRKGKRDEALALVLDYTPFPGSVCGLVCPHPCMDACSRCGIDEPIQINKLGLSSVDVKAEIPTNKTGKRIAIIGGGAAGLSAAWQLIRKGHAVTVYEKDPFMGGKMEEVIPAERLPRAILHKELSRIEKAGVQFVTGAKVTDEGFAALRTAYDAVIVAVGAHAPRTLTCPGGERAVDCLSYLGEIARGGHPKTGHHVIVIGGGDSAMDAAREAYAMGAETVAVLARSLVRAGKEETDYVKRLGADIQTHFMPKEMMDTGVMGEDGRFIPGDMVITAIGEEPVLDFLPESIDRRGRWLMPRRTMAIGDGLFAAGDVIRAGRLVDAIGSGARAAHFAHAYVMGEVAAPYTIAPAIPYSMLHLASFARFLPMEIPHHPEGDVRRCISCGTCRDCGLCVESCPRGAISRVDLGHGQFRLQSDPEKCIGCGICEGVCPCGIWHLHDNPEPIPMYKMEKPKQGGVSIRC